MAFSNRARCARINVGNIYSGNYRDIVVTNEADSAVVPGIFTTASGIIDYFNQGERGWALKPGSIHIKMVGTIDGPLGNFFDNGSGVLDGSFSQVPGGPVLPALGTVNYQTGSWSISLSEPFIQNAQFYYSYVVSEKIDYALYTAPLPKTGQTASYAPGDDGDLRYGLAWPNPRFHYEHDSGVVTDLLTGLMWLQSPHSLEENLTFHTWAEALTYCNSLEFGGYMDWRLPNRRELFSLISDGNHAPALPSSHPFEGIRQGYYWSSTTADNPGIGWSVGMEVGKFGYNPKSTALSVWPVRGPVAPAAAPSHGDGGSESPF